MEFQSIDPGLLRSGLQGVERETLRINRKGSLAMTPHPSVFGDKENNPHITVDFSESQLEIITSPHSDISNLWGDLDGLHQFVISRTGDELLWPYSMPPHLPCDACIPIARFSDTPSGREKETYRRGLALRYGKKMQMISGVHYNYSFHPELRSVLMHLLPDYGDPYLSMVRNLLRFRWFLILFLGASPLASGTEMNEKIVSLRMSRLGYSQNTPFVSGEMFNSLDSYIQAIEYGTRTLSPEYEATGTKCCGEELQLNAYIFQSEKEFYFPVRLKRNGAESLPVLLKKKGVEYVEIRSIDINPFERNGISLDQLYFLHAFMLFCALKESPPVSSKEDYAIRDNDSRAALSGRETDFMLIKGEATEIKASVWGMEIFRQLSALAAYLDRGLDSAPYGKSIDLHKQLFTRHELLLSSRVTRGIQENGRDIVTWGLKLAELYKQGEIINELSYSRV